MKVLIVEDERIAADRLERMLKEIEPTLDIQAKLDSVEESVRWLSKHSVDLIFLDIQLSDGISFEIFEQIDLKASIIFTTAYDEYALKAFKVNSVSYLLKPIRKEELAESIAKYYTLRSLFQPDVAALLAYIKGGETHYKQRFVIQIGNKIKQIELVEAAYFYALEKNVFLKTFRSKSYPMEYSLDALEKILDPKLFFRINRKMLINIHSIINMTTYSHSRIKLELTPQPDADSDIFVSIARVTDFKKWLE